MEDLEELTVDNKLDEESFGCIIVNNSKFDLTINYVSIINAETGDQLTELKDKHVILAEKSSSMQKILNYRKFRDDYTIDQFNKMRFKVNTDFGEFLSKQFYI
jgi:hypothetical protein